MTYVANALGSAGFGPYEVQWINDSPRLSPTSARPEVLLVPGFVDIHIHGAFGIDFMSASRSEMVTLCDRLAAEGYEAFLPTTVTAEPSSVLQAMHNLPEHEMILGFHLEGPFISPVHPGAQPIAAIAGAPSGGPGSDSPWENVFNHPLLKVVTLAPEIEGGVALVQRLSSRGVAVSMGHSDATYEQARLATAAGASHTTHTFNAMRGFHHREAGLAGFALMADDVYSELIYDRIHVSTPAAALLVKNKPVDKLVAVSDSTLATGLSPGECISMWGNECITSPGEVRLASNGALAGSAITLLDAFRNLHEDFGAETAIRSCCLNPRLSIGLSKPPTVWLELSDDLEILGMHQGTRQGRRM